MFSQDASDVSLDSLCATKRFAAVPDSSYPSACVNVAQRQDPKLGPLPMRIRINKNQPRLNQDLTTSLDLQHIHNGYLHRHFS